MDLSPQPAIVFQALRPARFPTKVADIGAGKAENVIVAPQAKGQDDG